MRFSSLFREVLEMVINYVNDFNVVSGFKRPKSGVKVKVLLQEILEFE